MKSANPFPRALLRELAPTLAGAALVSSASAAYVLVDDFESYTVATWNGGTSAAAVWTTNTAGNTGLVAIQDDGTTQHLAHGWNSGQRGASRTSPTILDGASGTYYFQVRTGDATPDVSFGLSDVASGAAFGFGEFEVQVALVNNGGTPALGARNGGTFTQLVTGLSADTWYDVWVVVDNATDTFDLYYGTTGDPDTLGTQIATDFGFRNGNASNDLVSFMTLSNNHEDLQADLDNIYFNPVAVPEPGPAVLMLGSLGCFGLARRRR